MVLCKLVVSQTEQSKEELAEAESKDKLEIVKQIKKINNDGSYTIGYEADDGSFKIESRDVQGNIKGTYGFVDDDGEVKRVSYSTKNSSSESVTKTEPSTSVVQRIPRVNKLPTVFPTQSSSSATTVIQSIARKRILPVTEATTTNQLNQTEEVSASNQEKTRISPTITSHQYSQKSNNQIVRPEFATTAPPPGRRLTQTNRLNEGEHTVIKPVTEQSEIHGNLLRRQTFDVQQHATNLRQSHGADAPDVYSASLTTGMPRVLFTTVRPEVKYTPIYHRNDVTTLSPSTQESTTTEAPQAQYTTQVPPNQVEPLVAIRHPYRGTVVVPLKELQNREQFEAIPYARNPPTDPRTVPVYVRRPPLHVLRSMPVQIDENGYVRELRPAPQIPYEPPQQYEEDAINNEIESIKPPVSVQDFQKLLDLLIFRQRRLEQANRLGQYENVYQAAAPIPYTIPRYQDMQQRGPVQFVPQEAETNRQDQRAQYRRVYYTPQPVQQSSRRVARLLKPERNVVEDYLPPDVREMLLLRMLQLAINPALPVDASDVESAPSVQMGRQAIRNVEILGEEDDGDKRIMRVKRLYHES